MKIFLVSVLVLSACASTRWAKSGASAQDYNVDSAYCRNDAYTRATNALGKTDMYVQEPLFQNCMQSKGWYIEEVK